AEMLKLLAADGAVAALTLMQETDVLRHVLPVDVDLAPLRTLIVIDPDSDALLRLAALLRSAADGRQAIHAVAAWRLSNVETTRLERLVRQPRLALPISVGDGRRNAYRLGATAYLDLLRLSADTKEQLDDALPVPEIPPFPLTGQDLIDRRMPPGPKVGTLLKQLEDWWLDHDLEPDRDACLAELDRRLEIPGNP
ncbi:MAG: CCA tRNA nucleotidyltransferase, partial [Geminicoccaceae bacterium]